jgi:hypothetical protein
VRAFAEWLYGTPLSVAIHSTFWLIRLLQATHLLTAGVAVGSGVMIALRAIGWQRADQPFEDVWKRFAPWLAWSLAIMAATGAAQTLGDPVREFTATSYWLKIALLLVCALGTILLGRAATARDGGSAANAGAFLRPTTRDGGSAANAGAICGRELSIAAKLAAAALIVCWLALPLLGRMIGYDLAIWGSWSLRT